MKSGISLKFILSNRTTLSSHSILIIIRYGTVHKGISREMIYKASKDIYKDYPALIKTVE